MYLTPCKRLLTRILRLKLNFFYSDDSITKESSVVSLGVTLRMMVELNSNPNVTIEIISKTKTKARN